MVANLPYTLVVLVIYIYIVTRLFKYDYSFKVFTIMGRKNKRDPQAKLTVEFFDLSRKGAKLREVPKEKKKKSTLDKMVAKKLGDDGKALKPEHKRNVEESVKVYKEALELYRDKIITKNPSYYAGAHQNVATALIDCRKYVEAEKYFTEAERISKEAGLSKESNHSSILENMVILYIKCRDWEKAERCAGDSLRLFPEDGSPITGGMKLLDKKARHAKLCTIVSKFEEAIELANEVIQQSSRKKKRKADLALIRSIAKSEHAILTRNEDLLQQAETEMSQSIQLAERGYGKKHTITAEHCEYNSMFQGGIRHDFNGAEILALKAADCREGHLKDLLAEEEFAKQKGAEEDKDIQYIDKDIMKDDRTKLMMEDCLAMLGNVHERRFLRPWQYLVWKGF